MEKSGEKKPNMLPAYLKGVTFRFYREEFSEQNALTEDANVFKKVKEKMV